MGNQTTVNHHSVTKANQKLTNKTLTSISAKVAHLKHSIKKFRYSIKEKRLSKKGYSLLVFPIITIILVSLFVFAIQNQNTSPVPQTTPQDPNSTTPTDDNPDPNRPPSPSGTQTPTIQDYLQTIISGMTGTTKTPGVIASSQTMNSTTWKTVAANAWSYFKPGTGLDSSTGLPYATIGYPYFTDWDLASYIQAVIDAEKVGLINKTDAWGANDRIERVLTFLENRPLTAENYPYWWYEATGKAWMEGSRSARYPFNVADSGKLLVALNNIKAYDSNVAARVDNIVKVRVNYAAMWESVSVLAASNNIYDYYVARGFAAFWPEKFSFVADKILTNIVTAPTVTTYGVKLPISKLTCDPLLLAIFDLPQTDPRLHDLMRQVFLAHVARSNTTGYYSAFSEGLASANRFVYEWVVLPDGSTWVLRDTNNAVSNVTPVIFTKVAFSFLALYNNNYTHQMATFIENATAEPKNGYAEGVEEGGPERIQVISNVGGNTNGLIVSAARYAIQNNP